MADYGSRYTDHVERYIAGRINEVYSEAEQDILRKIEDFNRKHEAKVAIHKKELQDGKITQEQFDAWMKGQVFQGKQWEAKRDQIVDTMTNANQVAVKMVNGGTGSVFAFNANYMAYTLEHDAGVNFGFGLYDSATVTNLIKRDPQLLPEWKIDQPKDYIWNKKKVNSSITQGIIQGETLDEIARRLSHSLAAQNENTMKTFARTAMTGAQNAGRTQRLEEARGKGINVKKQWMSTLDGRTRDSHRDMDGESVPTDKPFSNKLMYPGDPKGPAREVYNCRCTMVGDVVGYPAEYERYDNIDGRPIKAMTYKEWESLKAGVVIVNPFQSKLGLAKTVAEINDLMNSQGWWREKPYHMVNRADLTGCDLDSAKSIAAAYQQVFEKYPQLIGKFDAPDAQPRNMSNRTYAWCYLKKSGHVQVNPTFYSNWSALQESYDKAVVQGFHPYGTTAESIVTHEIGHAIDGLLAREGILGGVTAGGEYRYASSSLRSTIMKRCAKIDTKIASDMALDKLWGGNDAVAHAVSQYATENPQEWFAECFAEYITSANPRLVATEFGKELEKLLEKLL